MDYDRTEIPASYDQGRSHGPEVLALWMRAIASHLKDRSLNSILDLGCGTGRFSSALAEHFQCEVIGIDPSKKMLEQAQTKPHDGRVRYLNGYAESIPLTDNSVDLIFMSMVFHHFKNPATVAGECLRVLRGGGMVFLRAGVKDRIESYPYVPFFPATRSLLNDCLPPVEFMRETFESAGLQTISTSVITQMISPNLAGYADKLAVGADSVLAQLTPADFDSGMKALRERAATVVEPVFEPIDVLVFRKHKPPFTGGTPVPL